MLTLALTAALLTPQVPTEDPVTLQQVRVENHTDFARRDVITTTLPFAPDTYRGEPLSIDGGYAHVTQLGPPWPDGSWRTASVQFQTTLGSRESKLVDVTSGGRPAPGFVFSKSWGKRASHFGIHTPKNGHWFGPKWRIEEWTPLLLRLSARGRIPNTPFGAEIELEFRSGMDHARFWLDVGPADMTRPEQSYQLPPLWFSVKGPLVFPWDSQVKVTKQIGSAATTQYVRLDNGGKWGDGQAIAVQGSLQFAPDPGGDFDTLKAERKLPPFVVSTNWPQSGAHGCWGVVRGPPTNRAQQNARASKDYQAHTNAPPSWAVHGCAPDPNGTGDQGDFGSTPLLAEALGYPARLHSVRLSCLQESWRPTHLRNADGSLFRFTTRPEVLLWHSVNDHRITGNKLGKSRTLNWSDCRPSVRFGKWGGHGWEHWTTYHLAAYALMTSDTWAIRECEHKVELLLGTMQINSRSPVLNNPGASRAVGRMLQTGVMLWQVTGRLDLYQRIFARIGVVDAKWRGKTTSPVRPAVVRGKDFRNLGGQLPFWMPWQQAIGARGLDAVWQQTGDTRARDLAKVWARNVFDYGIFKVGNRYRAAKAVEWRNGGAWPGWTTYTTTGDALPPQLGLDGEPPMTLDELADLIENPPDAPPLPPNADPSPIMVEFYDPYILWMMPAVRIVRRHAIADGDTAAVQKADAIEAQVRRSKSWKTERWLAID